MKAMKAMGAILDRLEELNEMDLRSLNHTIVGMINQARKRREFKSAQQFNIGDYASFTSKYGELVVIRIERINTSSIRGRTAEPVTWSVSPTLLKPSTFKEWKGK